MPFRTPAEQTSEISLENCAFGSQNLDKSNLTSKSGPRGTVLSSIASSCDDRSLIGINKTRSMDAIIDEVRFDIPRRTSSLNGQLNCPNGGITSDLMTDDDLESPNAPLLSNVGLNTVIRKRNVNENDNRQSKRWKSLENVQMVEDVVNDGCLERKDNATANNSLKNWIVGLFNGNGLRTSNASLRKGVLTGYSDLQVERESIV